MIGQTKEGQEKKSNTAFKSWAEEKYSVSFMLLEKGKLATTDKLWSHLQEEQPGKKLTNFTKFLVNRKGEVVNRVTSPPNSLEKEIKELLAEK